MKKNLNIYKILPQALIVVLMLLINSCKGTWIMYDTSQKDRLYFETAVNPKVLSFALLNDETMQYSVPIKMMGMPVDQDREFQVEFVDMPAGATLQVDDAEIPIFTAKEGDDFEVSSIVLPAGAIQTKLNFTLKRTEILKEKLAGIKLRIVETDEFMPMAQDSTDIDAIVSQEVTFYFNDADPVCPYWWGTSESAMGYQMYVGNFYVEKYRYMLDLFHDIEGKNAAIYEMMLGKYGYNIDVEGLRHSFWSVQDQAVWATYVLIPTYLYFKAFYEENPDHPNATKDTFGTKAGDWQDPVKLLR